ncbi:FadR/GntR family transcriptional regulator [Pseudonocardia benzenivorans]|uniref:GntR domain protein n=2 Tax=Pseudonocardia TaxID=1847 RepID=F4CUL4_PSEUX|nr:FCD domain-containing protein [Pseudonocardia dioxanivorans]AEA26328.1 GntR domain protein [Pseudonocardia dioxanivorans CB1190]GJF03197.1 GntR family transcriptional regulator [Pseudonocardia sp. D17]
MQRSGQSSGAKPRLYLAVAQQLLTSVATGEYAAGTRLPGDRDLAERLDVSRATAREAILALEIVGAVEVRHGDGTYVRTHPAVAAIEASALDVAPRELIEARRSVEPAVAALAATRIDGDTVGRLRRILAEAAELVAEPAEVTRFLALGLRFHGELALGCGNTLLAGIVGQFVNAESHPLWVLVNQLAVSSPAARESQLAEHTEIVDVITAGDSGAAAATMAAHLAAVDTVIFDPAAVRAATATS